VILTYSEICLNQLNDKIYLNIGTDLHKFFVFDRFHFNNVLIVEKCEYFTIWTTGKYKVSGLK
jgi:hypothetical protein